MSQFCVTDIQQVFHDVFKKDYRVRLEFGASEPFYKAATNENEENILYSREDFFASALHEIAHWCVAGEKRRQRDDFGYWYIPDGRNLRQQKAFEKVEVLPQTYELAFSKACGYQFKASSDNLDLDEYDPSSFIESINSKYIELCENGFPKRVEDFCQALRDFYKKRPYISKAQAL